MGHVPEAGGVVVSKEIKLEIEGEFLEIYEPESLTYSWSIDPTSQHRETVVVRFEHHQGGTMVSLTHSRITSEAVAEGHRQGWDSFLAGLVAHLSDAPQHSL